MIRLDINISIKFISEYKIETKAAFKTYQDKEIFVSPWWTLWDIPGRYLPIGSENAGHVTRSSPPSLLLAVKPVRRVRTTTSGASWSISRALSAWRTAAMVQTCSAYGCKNRYHKDKDISFHKYVHLNYVCVLVSISCPDMMDKHCDVLVFSTKGVYQPAFTNLPCWTLIAHRQQYVSGRI